MTAGCSITEQEYDAIRKLLLDQSAFVLELGKEYLVETRLAPIVRELQLGSIGELIARVRLQPNEQVCRQIVEAMVTTESSFFRDHHPFEAIGKVVLPDLIERRSKERRLTIWSAASSTGQEPYSVALLIREHFPQLADWRISIVASDLSRQVLERAREGRYSQLEVNRGLPAALLIKYFDQGGTDWQLKAEVRQMVEFHELNLAKTWPPLPRMDLVLLRNVMIYFDLETKKNTLSKLERVLRPDGYLVLGSAESPWSLSNAYRRVDPLRAGVYQLAKSEQGV